jgi:hypothetical protein
MYNCPNHYLALRGQRLDQFVNALKYSSTIQTQDRDEDGNHNRRGRYMYNMHRARDVPIGKAAMPAMPAQW